MLTAARQFSTCTATPFGAAGTIRRRIGQGTSPRRAAALALALALRAVEGPGYPELSCKVVLRQVREVGHVPPHQAERLGLGIIIWWQEVFAQVENLSRHHQPTGWAYFKARPTT